MTSRLSLQRKTHERTPGVRRRALLIQDVESLTDAWRLETHSDVFALHQEEVRATKSSRVRYSMSSVSVIPTGRISFTLALAMAQSDVSTRARERQDKRFSANHRHSSSHPVPSHI